MKRGFTMTEVLSVLAIFVITAAIAYPAFGSAKRASGKSACVSNLRQIGQALAVYREENGGSDAGTPVQMGLPPVTPVLRANPSGPSFQCHGNDPRGNYYTDNYPAPEDPPALRRFWTRYVGYVGSSAIVLYDANHQSSHPRSVSWQDWTAIGLRLDTSVTIRTRRGYPFRHQWWHK